MKYFVGHEILFKKLSTLVSKYMILLFLVGNLEKIGGMVDNCHISNYSRFHYDGFNTVKKMYLNETRTH